MNNAQLRDEVIRISGVNPSKCMGCGKCSATCPAYDEMEFHPHQFVSMIKNGDLAPLLQSDSLFRCLSCFACVERCPRGVEPAKLIEAGLLVLTAGPGMRLLPPLVITKEEMDQGVAIMKKALG